MCDIKVYNSICSIEKKEWDELTQDNVFMSYEYLKTFEETKVFPLVSYYITINEGGRIIGASVCHFEPWNEARILDKIILGKLLKYRWTKNISSLPAVICNRQRGDGTHFIFHPDLSNDRIITLQDKILDEIENIAKENKASLCFMNVTEDELHLIELLKLRGYSQSVDLPSNFFDIKWNSFEEYLEFLSLKYKNIKKQIRHELNRNRKMGVVIEQLQNINGHEKRLLELLKMNHFKYNSYKFPFKENYFRQIKENFGNNALIFTAVKDGVIIGVCIQLRKGKEAFLANLAADHERSQNDYSLFNVGYYEPIKHAVKCNLARLYFGRGTYIAKIRRGCSNKDILIFYKPQKKLNKPAVKLWFGFHKLWMRRKLAYIKKL
ncbi:MAG TPA: peptidogalycan biosysnthesis protein [Ignavibacteriaceae bacterium]|nr:peptidogalycan biosysnthesis protein [Ignavibacteriaceae bacterium]